MINFYYLKEAAEILGIKYERLNSLCIQGKISYGKLGKRRVFFEEHIRELKERNNVV